VLPDKVENTKPLFKPIETETETKTTTANRGEAQVATRAGPKTYAREEKLQQTERQSERPAAQFLNVGPVDRTLVADAARLRDAAPSTSLSRELARFVDAYENGDISSDQFAAYVAELSDRAANERADKRTTKAMTPRIRGADFIRQRLLEAKRRGDLTAEGVDFAEWVIQRNPELVEQLGLTIRQETEGSEGSSGQYFPLSRVMRLIKGSESDVTIVHEIMHHLERMMPTDVQDRIRQEWQRRFDMAERAAGPPLVRGYFQLLRSYHTGINQETGTPLKASDYAAILAKAQNLINSGRVAYANYQYFNPSEFWAVNAANILQGRFGVTGSVLNRLRQWVRELLTFLTNRGGNRAILQGLRAAMQGEGLQRSAEMLHTTGTYLNVAPKGPKAPKGPTKAQLKAEAAAKKPGKMGQRARLAQTLSKLKK